MTFFIELIGSHRYNNTGYYYSSSFGYNVTTSVVGHLTSRDYNSYAYNGNLQFTIGELKSQFHTRTVNMSAKMNDILVVEKISEYTYPFDVQQYGATNINTLQINASIMYARQRSESRSAYYTGSNNSHFKVQNQKSIFLFINL